MNELILFKEIESILTNLIRIEIIIQMTELIFKIGYENCF
jgi:hypothetical protein